MLCCRNRAYGIVVKKGQCTTPRCLQTQEEKGLYENVKVFVAFCVFMKVALSDVSIKVIVSFLECLVANECSASMVANYMSVIKANFIVFDLNFHVCDHPKVKYFIKSIKINRPLSVVHHNIIDISMLKCITCAASTLPGGPVLKAIILTGFFTFLRLSNLCPHSAAAFNSSRHLTS